MLVLCLAVEDHIRECVNISDVKDRMQESIIISVLKKRHSHDMISNNGQLSLRQSHTNFHTVMNLSLHLHNRLALVQLTRILERICENISYGTLKGIFIF
ncbi:hypothetical protein RRG08_037952 [Elysia crispata]|uniref:Uncharacterized protein n=1 Tax=Elysia crispata TaxID=231223 RepID=A0AAE1ABQ4_9GAST|nr:hypothetical protein RRG08_037952 [Elysia crispata]